MKTVVEIYNEILVFNQQALDGDLTMQQVKLRLDLLVEDAKNLGTDIDATLILGSIEADILESQQNSYENSDSDYEESYEES
jgi:hypothetical protein